MSRWRRTKRHPEGLCDCGAHFVLGGELSKQPTVKCPGCDADHGLVLVKDGSKLVSRIPSRKNRRKQRRIPAPRPHNT